MADYFDCFSVSFGDSEVFFGGKTFVLGQCSTDILNLDDALLTELDVLIGKLTPAVRSCWKQKQTAPHAPHRSCWTLSGMWCSRCPSIGI
jgi:hypothetical protein